MERSVIQELFPQLPFTIFHMPLEIAPIQNGVFPVTLMQQVICSFGSASKRNAPVSDSAGEGALEHLPAAWEIVIPRWERPYRMKVSREHDYCRDSTTARAARTL